MRRFVLGFLLLSTACSKAPDSSSVGEPDVAGNSLSDVAFEYAYSFVLPSNRIAGLQDGHASACEALGAARCRVTGLRYSVGTGGSIDASLSLKLAAGLARRFGRDGVKTAEAAGATLTGADISGTDVATVLAASGTATADVEADQQRIARELARTDLRVADRAELLRQQAALTTTARAARDNAAEQQERLATTPLTFSYRTGRGNSIGDRVGDAGDVAVASVGITLTAVLWLFSALGPPALAALVLFLLWRRLGRHAWAWLLARTDRMPPPD